MLFLRALCAEGLVCRPWADDRVCTTLDWKIFRCFENKTDPFAAQCIYSFSFSQTVIKHTIPDQRKFDYVSTYFLSAFLPGIFENHAVD